MNLLLEYNMNWLKQFQNNYSFSYKNIFSTPIPL